jgi:hypothetical protein
MSRGNTLFDKQKRKRSNDTSSLSRFLLLLVLISLHVLQGILNARPEWDFSDSSSSNANLAFGRRSELG